MEEGENALLVFTGCSSAAEGGTREKHAVTCWNWHGWQTGRLGISAAENFY